MKSREHVITNGRAAFYASMWNDFRQIALDHGWTLGLHGSLATDMDIIAVAWTEDAKPVRDMIIALEKCFNVPEDSICFPTKISMDNPNNRIVFTVHIWADFYLDINIVNYLNEDFEDVLDSKK